MLLIFNSLRLSILAVKKAFQSFETASYDLAEIRLIAVDPIILQR